VTHEISQAMAGEDDIDTTPPVRHVTGNDQDYLGESPEWLFRYLRFSKRATVGVRATYATR
jgi:hypothetical protein